MSKDALSVRQKEFYEKRTRTYLPRRTYTIIRIDGKAFHTYTKSLNKPFDEDLIEAMDSTAIYLCKNIQGAKLAYVQSDEITIVMTDFDTLQTDAWFDGEVQKIVSVSASMATREFNRVRIIQQLANGIDIKYILNGKLAEFDSRVFTIPFKEEVLNNIIWRQRDCVRNSISSVAQSLFSHTLLTGKNQSDMQEMCFEKGVNWNDFPEKQKRGRVIVKKQINYPSKNGGEPYIRNEWKSIAAPDFNKDRSLFDEIFNFE